MWKQVLFIRCLRSGFWMLDDNSTRIRLGWAGAQRVARILFSSIARSRPLPLQTPYDIYNYVCINVWQLRTPPLLPSSILRIPEGFGIFLFLRPGKTHRRCTDDESAPAPRTMAKVRPRLYFSSLSLSLVISRNLSRILTYRQMKWQGKKQSMMKNTKKF